MENTLGFNTSLKQFFGGLLLNVILHLNHQSLTYYFIEFYCPFNPPLNSLNKSTNSGRWNIEWFLHNTGFMFEHDSIICCTGWHCILCLLYYRAVFLGDFKCVISFSDVMTTGTLIGIIFGVVCVPLMGCVIAVFLGPCFRGEGFGGRTHKTTFKKYRYHHPDRDGEPMGIMVEGSTPPHSTYM